LQQNQSADGTFSFEIDESTPTGDTVNFIIDVTANNGIYNTSFELSFLIGKYPILIVDLDGNHNSGTVMQTVISNLDITAVYETSLPDNLDMYQCIFVCLGVYNNNHVLSNAEGDRLAAFLNHGGRLYMEGGDTWFYDPATAVHGMFKIQGVSDGSGDLGLIFGQNGSFAEGLVYQYGGDNNYIDRIAPIDNAFQLFLNQVPSYCNAVALDEGSYKTVGCSFEFGGLNDGQHTREELMILILEFFGGVLTDIGEAPVTSQEISVQCRPNPFGENVNFNFRLDESSIVKLNIYRADGKKIKTLTNHRMPAGTHQLNWDGTSDRGSRMPDGLYIYVLEAGQGIFTGKIIMAH